MCKFPKGIDQVTTNATEDKGEDSKLGFWDSLLFLMGYLGLNAYEFWDMQYNELIIRYEAYRDQKNAQIKHDYDLTRWQTFLLLQPHIDNKKGNLNKPTDLVRFEWDAIDKPKELKLTEAQKQIIAKMDNAVFTNKEDVFDELYNIGKKNGINR